MAKILIVTSDTKSAAGVEALLARDGHTVDIAISGEEALRRAEDGNPDCVLLGSIAIAPAVFTAQVRKNAALGNLPVIVFTEADISGKERLMAQVNEALTHKRVLIAEDDRQMSAILRVVLEKAGYDVRTTHDGAETVAEIKAWHPHLVVLDIMLPIIDGFHICQMMNEDPSFDPRPRVLIISGRGSDWDQHLGAACGAEEYLVKPINHTLFLSKVREITART